MKRRNFLLIMFSLASSVSFAKATIAHAIPTAKTLPKTKGGNTVIRSGWILLDSDK